MSNLDNWYREKFSLRIEYNNLLERGAVDWHDFTLAQKSSISAYINDTSELYFGFYQTSELWTVIGTKHIFSLYDGNFVVAKLSDILGETTPIYDKSKSKKEILKCGFLQLDNENKVIWLPQGYAIVGMMNTLLYVTDKYMKAPAKRPSLE